MRKFLQAIMTALCLAAAVSGYWIWSAQQLRDGLADWRQKAGTDGRRVSYENPQIEGFPLQLALSLQDPAIEAPGRWQWSGPTIEAQNWLFKPQAISVKAAGIHRLSFSEGQRTDQVSVAPRQADADIQLDNRGHVETARLTLGDTTGSINSDLHFDLAKLTAAIGRKDAAAGQPSPRIDLDLTAQGFSLRNEPLQPFSSDIQTFEFDGQLFGWHLLKGRIDDWNHEELQRWRDSGGHLDIDRLHLIWDRLSVTASGKLDLDDKLRPHGKLDAWWRGLADVIDQLTAAKKLKAEGAMVIKFGLQALPSRTADDGTTEVNLPLTLDEGQLSLGLFPLAKLRPL